MNPRARGAVRLAILLVSSALVVALGFAGCGGDNGTAPTTGSGTVSGVVQNVNGNAAIAGAAVTASSGATATTDAQGRFSISVPAGQRVRVDVTKATFSLNQLVVQLAAGESKSFAVGLMAAGTTSSVDVAAGGLVTDAASNATLSLPADFVTASGSVSVTVTGLDPTTDQIKALPGGLDAVDANGQPVYLTPVSFAEYTVKDGSGNVLQFNPSASQGADIELPIPASLQGQPGYQNGDPIECYVYDPADGKWKTPVPGVIGPSSVDGQPAIKATIFHLSWYGGAPAGNDVGCVEGVVTLNGQPAANVDVEAFPGGSTKTNAQGFYRVQAALNSTVRVVASQSSGTTFRFAEGSTTVGGSPTPCAVLDLELGDEQEGEIKVEAFISSNNQGATPFDLAYASLYAQVGLDRVPITTAEIELRTGATAFTLAHSGNGFYMIGTGTGDFALLPGHTYTISIDVTNDGTWDGSGDVVMVGNPVITFPTAKSTVPPMFTATWTDPGTSVGGYSATYFGAVSPVGEVDTSAANLFLTTARSKVIGDGTVDPVYLLPNPPLEPGDYEFEIISANGPYWYFIDEPGSDFDPNVTGPNLSGYLSALGIGDVVPFSSAPPVGSSAVRPAPAGRQAVSRWPLPPSLELAMKRVQDRLVRSRPGASKR